MGKYDDIINLQHPEPQTHPRMSEMNRAAQFAPFAALTGYDDEIVEAGRLTDHQISLDENKKDILDHKLQLAMEERNRSISIKYFVKDEKKTGGAYTYLTGTIKKIDALNKCIVMNEGDVVSLDKVVDIDFVDTY